MGGNKNSGNPRAAGVKGHDGSNAGRKPLPEHERKSYQLSFVINQRQYDAVTAEAQCTRQSKAAILRDLIDGLEETDMNTNQRVLCLSYNGEQDLTKKLDGLIGNEVAFSSPDDVEIIDSIVCFQCIPFRDGGDAVIVVNTLSRFQ